MSLPSLKFYRLFIDFAAPLSSVALMMLGNGFYTTFITLYLNAHGYTGAEIGYAQSAYFLGMFLGGFKMESVIVKIGHIQTLAVFGSLGTSAILFQGLWAFFPAWVFLRFLIGLSIAAIYIVIESWMLDRSNAKVRGVVLSIYMIVLYTAQSTSQQFLTLFDIDSYVPFLIAALFTSLSVIPVGLSTQRFHLPAPHETAKFSQIFKISPFGTSGCLASGLILSTIYSFFPLFAIEKLVPSEQLMFVTIAGGVILQWPIGKLSDFVERRVMLIAVVFITLFLGLIALILPDPSETTILILSFLIGGFSFTLYPVSTTQVCDHLEHAHITKATAFLLLVYGLGSVAGPLIASVFIEALGIDAIFLFFSFVLGITGFVGVYMWVVRPRIPFEEQNIFIPLSREASISYEMDPRKEDKKGRKS